MYRRWLLLAVLALGVQAAELRVGDADAKRAAVKRPAPEYPPVARQLKISGKVELEIVIAPDGAVEDVKILSGNPVLTKPCVAALKEWKFNPFLDDNHRPARAIDSLSFEFRQ